MAIFQGLAEGMTNAFMTPFLQRQQMDRQDQRKRQQGELLRQGLFQLMGSTSPEALALKQMPPEIMQEMANPVLGQYNQRIGNEREDTVRQQEYDREDALLKTKFGREDTQQQQENEGFFQVLDIINPGMGQRVRQNQNVRYSPQAQNAILNTLENQQNVQKINADVKAQYPNAPAFQTVQAAVDWVNNQQGMARDARTLDRQMSMYDYRQGGKQQVPGVSDEEMTPFVQEVRTAHQMAKNLEELRQMTADPDYQAAMETIEEWDRNYWMQLQREYLNIKNRLRWMGTR